MYIKYLTIMNSYEVIAPATEPKKETYLEKYGCESIFLTENAKLKTREFYFERFGNIKPIGFKVIYFCHFWQKYKQRSQKFSYRMLKGQWTSTYFFFNNLALFYGTSQ
jgi:hypothetical protein